MPSAATAYRLGHYIQYHMEPDVDITCPMRRENAQIGNDMNSYCDALRTICRTCRETSFAARISAIGHYQERRESFGSLKLPRARSVQRRRWSLEPPGMRFKCPIPIPRSAA